MSALNRSKFLEPGEVETLQSSLDLSQRNDTLVALALETGARASELLALTRQDLFVDTQTVFFKGLKGSKDRELPVRAELFAALLTHVPFNIKYRRLEQVWRIKRPVPKKFHSLRHTFAVNLYRRTKDIKLVQLALGHASPTNTAVYTDFQYSLDELKRILPSNP